MSKIIWQKHKVHILWSEISRKANTTLTIIRWQKHKMFILAINNQRTNKRNTHKATQQSTVKWRASPEHINKKQCKTTQRISEHTKKLWFREGWFGEMRASACVQTWHKRFGEHQSTNTIWVCNRRPIGSRPWFKRKKTRSWLRPEGLW